MKKPLKILAWAVGVLVGLLVLALVVVTLLFDPNDYKEEIVTAAKNTTGRELRIDGNLSWTLFPWLGVKAEGLALGNAPGFGPHPFDPPFAKVGSAGVSVRLLPLFIGRVNVDTLHVRDLALNLAKDAAGRSNWEFAGARQPAPAPKPMDKPAPGAALGAIAIGGVDVRNANVSYRDAADGSAYAVRNLDLITDSIAFGQAVRTSLAGTLEYGKPARQAKLALRTALTVAEKSAALRDINLQLDDSTLTGTVEIADMEKSALRFDLALDRIDLDRYLDTAAPDKAAKPTAATPAAAPLAIPISTLRTLDAQGKLRIGSLKAMGIRSSDIAIQLAARNGLLTLGPNTAKLYGGTYAGRTVLDVRPARPQLTLDEQLNAVQLGPFLKDADLFDRYSGTGEVALKLTAQGLDAQQIKQTLNGSARVNLRDGKIEGVNLQKIVTEARRLYDSARGKSVSVTPAASDETAFKALHASANITNGVARTNDLKLDGPVLRAEGAGSADLTRETLDYRIQVTVAEAADRKGTTVPLRIGGTFAQPTYGVEFEAILKQEAERKLEQKLEKKLDEKLDRLFRRKN
jgi:AsmA protein